MNFGQTMLAPSSITRGNWGTIYTLDGWVFIALFRSNSLVLWWRVIIFGQLLFQALALKQKLIF